MKYRAGVVVVRVKEACRVEVALDLSEGPIECV
jgi:hypothetical protein